MKTDEVENVPTDSRPNLGKKSNFVPVPISQEMGWVERIQHFSKKISGPLSFHKNL